MRIRNSFQKYFKTLISQTKWKQKKKTEGKQEEEESINAMLQYYNQS